MLDRFKRRYLDLIGSIYIYNEHRGYTAIERVLTAVRARAPNDHHLLAAIEQHRADERKHYLMFRRWFELRGVMPFAVGRNCGHIDRFVEILFRSTIDGLDTDAVIARDDLFEKLCRVRATAAQRHSPSPASFRFLAIGRLVRQKNMALLINAFAQARSAGDTLTIVGDGPQRESLKALIDKRCIADRVRMSSRSPRSSSPAASGIAR